MVAVRRRRSQRSCRADGSSKPDPPVAVAIAEQRQVDGQDDRPVAGRRGPLDERTASPRVGLDVELEPAGRRPARRPRPSSIERDDVVESVNGTPAAAAAAGGRRLAVGVGQAVGGHRGDRRPASAVRAPRSVVDGSTPVTSTRTRGREPTSAPGGVVLREGDLVPCAARDVIEGGRSIRSRASDSKSASRVGSTGPGRRPAPVTR